MRIEKRYYSIKIGADLLFIYLLLDGAAGHESVNNDILLLSDAISTVNTLVVRTVQQ